MRRAAAVLLFFAALPSARGAGWDRVPRTVLALYAPDHIPGKVRDVFFLPLHQRAEMPLNHLGVIVEYADATKPLPEPRLRPDVLGAVAWFPAQKAFADPRPVCRWLKKAMGAGWKVVLLGRLGLYSNAAAPFSLAPECASALSLLGFEAKGVRTVDPLAVSVSSAAKETGFERRPDPSETGVVPLVTLSGPGTAYLRLELKDGEEPYSEPVAATPRGGLALEPFLLYANEQTDPPEFRWVIDPFAFFEEALGLRGLPRPDLTTLSGRRLYMSRIDGDGIYNLSELGSESGSARRKPSGEVFLKEIIQRYPNSPFTVSLIAGYYDLALYADAQSLSLGKKLLTRPNVEPASHGYAHPLNWREKTVALNIPRYEMSGEQETVGSMRLLEDRLLNRSAEVRLFQWTGDCLPREEDLRRLEEGGFLNLNGGGGRYDRFYPSYANLFPLSRPLGRGRQYYAPAFNENEYTDLWSARYYGYRDVIETFERTETPRRVKPVDVYMHFYSAERYAALNALKSVYEWALSKPLTPVMGSRYAEAAAGFFRMSISRRGRDRFLLKDGRSVRTVRFDGREGYPDLRASRGVVGYRRTGGALYVSLDESDEREVVLARAKGPGVFLEEANFEVSAWTPAADGAAFAVKGWWTPEFVLGGLKPGRAYRVDFRGFAEELTADAEGRLTSRLPGEGVGPTEGRVRVEAVR